jgi:mono/diheme cytochrome c family protein
VLWTYARAWYSRDLRHSLKMKFLGLSVVMLAGSLALSAQPADTWPPATLRDTGLYADWASKTVGPEKLRFSPQYPLWTDGAKKTRWMELPRGRFIDASNPDAWRFPIGTRFWKEFAFDTRAETRFIERTATGWKYATYAWNEDGSEAILAPEKGIARSVMIREGVRHGIPSRADCKSCHEGSPGRILGFSTLQLSADRDPNAPHAEVLPADAVTLRTLVERRLVRGLPSHLMSGMPRIAASTPIARAALGYLHGNCSYCHTLSGELASLKFSLQYPFAAPFTVPPAVSTTIGKTSKFVPAAWEAAGVRVHAGDPDRSVLAFRMETRNPVAQMPPVGSRLVDEEAVALIRKWIAEDLVKEKNR